MGLSLFDPIGYFSFMKGKHFEEWVFLWEEGNTVCWHKYASDKQVLLWGFSILQCHQGYEKKTLLNAR